VGGAQPPLELRLGLSVSSIAAVKTGVVRYLVAIR
jgi:hypothetical protein